MNSLGFSICSIMFSTNRDNFTFQFRCLNSSPATPSGVTRTYTLVRLFHQYWLLFIKNIDNEAQYLGLLHCSRTKSDLSWLYCRHTIHQFLELVFQGGFDQG